MHNRNGVNILTQVISFNAEKLTKKHSKSRLSDEQKLLNYLQISLHSHLHMEMIYSYLDDILKTNSTYSSNKLKTELKYSKFFNKSYNEGGLTIPNDIPIKYNATFYKFIEDRQEIRTGVYGLIANETNKSEIKKYIDMEINNLDTHRYSDKALKCYSEIADGYHNIPWLNLISVTLPMYLIYSFFEHPIFRAATIVSFVSGIGLIMNEQINDDNQLNINKLIECERYTMPQCIGESECSQD